MTGVPSIVFGLFIYITLVIGGFGGTGFAGWKGSVALALLMLPVVTRSAEVVLLLVPDSLREAALALGAPRWRVVVPDRAADRAAGPGHRLAAGRRPRGGRDRAAAVHRRRSCSAPRFNLNEPHELAARPDLQRRRPGRRTGSCSARGAPPSRSSLMILAPHPRRPPHRREGADLT